ncbi:MAG TPA: energy transducer TonB [Terracidiphilus sp.]|jgi:protein TonB|nr:energy transducer TonB [Terracidiphilus sp.]
MFEDSTFESTGRIRTRSRGWSVAALLLNGSVLAALIVIPLIYPEALPKQMMSILLVAPSPPPAAPKPLPQQPAQVFHGQRQLVGLNLTAPTQIPTTIRQINTPEQAPGNQLITMDTGPGIPGSDPFRDSGARPVPVVRAAPRGPFRVSQGVAEGMILQKTLPRYPPIALASRTQGTVVLQAVISKAGTIEDIHVVRGSPMLQQAAIDAVSQWRYRPYLLDGQPVAVETTVVVVFSLN